MGIKSRLTYENKHIYTTFFSWKYNLSYHTSIDLYLFKTRRNDNGYCGTIWNNKSNKTFLIVPNNKLKTKSLWKRILVSYWKINYYDGDLKNVCKNEKYFIFRDKSFLLFNKQAHTLNPMLMQSFDLFRMRFRRIIIHFRK